MYVSISRCFRLFFTEKKNSSVQRIISLHKMQRRQTNIHRKDNGRTFRQQATFCRQKLGFSFILAEIARRILINFKHVYQPHHSHIVHSIVRFQATHSTYTGARRKNMRFSFQSVYRIFLFIGQYHGALASSLSFIQLYNSHAKQTIATHQTFCLAFYLLLNF